MATSVFIHKNSRNSGGTASASLFFRFAEPSQPRISAENEMLLAVNSLQNSENSQKVP